MLIPFLSSTLPVQAWLSISFLALHSLLLSSMLLAKAKLCPCDSQWYLPTLKIDLYLIGFPLTHRSIQSRAANGFLDSLSTRDTISC